MSTFRVPMSFRKGLALAATGLAVVSMSACTSNTSKCVNGTCTVTLSGKGAKTDLNDKLPVQLNSAEGGSADVNVGKQHVVCKQGEVKEFNDASVTCEEVGNNKVKLKIVAK